MMKSHILSARASLRATMAAEKVGQHICLKVHPVYWERKYAVRAAQNKEWYTSHQTVQSLTKEPLSLKQNNPGDEPILGVSVANPL